MFTNSRAERCCVLGTRGEWRRTLPRTDDTAGYSCYLYTNNDTSLLDLCYSYVHVVTRYRKYRTVRTVLLYKKSTCLCIKSQRAGSPGAPCNGGRAVRVPSARFSTTVQIRNYLPRNFPASPFSAFIAASSLVCVSSMMRRRGGMSSC